MQLIIIMIRHGISLCNCIKMFLQFTTHVICTQSYEILFRSGKITAFQESNAARPALVWIHGKISNRCRGIYIGLWEKGRGNLFF